MHTPLASKMLALTAALMLNSLLLSGAAYLFNQQAHSGVMVALASAPLPVAQRGA